MAINFPTSPVDGQTLTVGETVFVYRSAKGVWDLQTANLQMQRSRNYLINGGMDLWQRGTTAFTTNGVYTADRWYNTFSAGTASITQSTDVPSDAGTTYSLSFASTSGTQPTILQRIGASNSTEFAGKQVTLSVWAKSTTGTAGLSYVTGYPTGTDSFSVTVNDVSGAFAASMTVGTWTRYTATFTATASATAGYQVRIFRNVTTTSTTTRYTGVQLELGPSATTFRRSGGTIQGEFAECQRYYIRFSGGSASHNTYFGHGFGYDASNARFGIPIPVTMRVAPTAITYNNLRGYNGSTTLSGTITLYAAGSRPTLLCVSLSDGTVSAGTNYALEGVGSGSVPYISADAEL